MIRELDEPDEAVCLVGSGSETADSNDGRKGKLELNKRDKGRSQIGTSCLCRPSRFCEGNTKNLYT